MAESFLNTQRLLRGPWQAFERDVARLLLVNGFSDVRVVGGTGDAGSTEAMTEAARRLGSWLKR